MPIAEQSVHRIYSCTNKECQGQFSIKQKVSDKWRKKCPFCNKHSLIIDGATLNISTFIDTKKAKTLGSISDQNKQRFEKERGQEKQVGPKVPFWRKGKKKVDFNILKNPNKYIQTGSV